MSRTLQTLMLVMAAWLWSAPTFAAPPEADAPAATAPAEDGSDAPEAKAEDAEPAKTEDAKEDRAAAAESDTGTGGETGDAAPGEIKTDEEAAEAAKGLYEAINSDQWPLAVGLGLMLLVFAVRKFVPGDKLSSMGPWLAAILGVAGYVAVALTNNPEGDWMEAVTQGLMAGAAAVGFWEMLGKKILARKAKS